MSETSEAKGAASRSRRRQPVSARNRQYMIAPAGLGVTRQTLVDRLNKFENIEILRTYAERENICPPIAVVRASDQPAAVLRRSVAGLRRSVAGAFVIEPDHSLRAASFVGALPQTPMLSATTAFGPGFKLPNVPADCRSERPGA